MKNIYHKPETEQVVCEVEGSACATASGTEKFQEDSGTWNTMGFNY